jgi:hypothetical protein
LRDAKLAGRALALLDDVSIADDANGFEGPES